MKRTLVVILVIAFGGLCFSGYLTYRELFGASEVASCAPVGEPGTMLGSPPCIYGFAMYLAICVLATFALLARYRQSA